MPCSSTPRCAILLPLLLAVIPASSFAQATSSVNLIASPNPATYGQAVTLQATVTAGATGKVTFYDGTTVLGVAAVSGNAATLVTKLLPAGTRYLRAYYAGDTAFGASTSAVVPQAVTGGSSLGFKAAVTSRRHRLLCRGG